MFGLTSRRARATARACSLVVPPFEFPAGGLIPGLMACGVLLLLGCEDERTLEATVPAGGGISQVGRAEGGPLLDEDVACKRVRDAFSDAKRKNACQDLEVPVCPEFIRPAGSLRCVQYSEQSVTACVAKIEAYDSCRDFVVNSCLVVAVPGQASKTCPDRLDAGSDGGSSDSGASDGGDAAPVRPKDASSDAMTEGLADTGAPDASELSNDASSSDSG